VSLKQEMLLSEKRLIPARFKMGQWRQVPTAPIPPALFLMILHQGPKSRLVVSGHGAIQIQDL